MVRKEVKTLILEQMCLETPESTIQVLIEEIAGFEEAKRQIPVVNDDEGEE